MSTYAIIPEEQWEGELVDRFPHAPHVQNYRVLVFADADTWNIKKDYGSRGIVEYDLPAEVVEHIENTLKPWIILQIEPLKEVMEYFSPPSDVHTY